jgi:hypothetical protein
MMHVRIDQRGGMRPAITLLVGASTIWQTALRAAEDIAKVADQAIRRLDLQITLPVVPEPAKPPQFNLQLPPEVMWLVIIIAIAVLLYALRDMIPIFGPKRDSWTQDEEFLGDTKLRASEATLSAADELAKHGDFVEAMHTLLLQGLAVMRERLNEQFSDALTSREILHSAKLPQDGRTSLRDIITRVEWTYFGKRPATRTDYDACRASFSALTQSLHRGAAA